MSFIHELSDVQTAKIGTGSRIWQYCIVLKGAQIGRDCNICSHVLIENDVKIGNSVTVKSGVQIWDGITIEDNVFVGPNVTFANDRYPKSRNTNYKCENVTVKKGASIGANSTILPGVVIGEYSMIGAGSVVTKDVPEFSVYFGNPAVFKNYICKCGNIFKENVFKCDKCGLQYTLKDNRLELIND